MIGLVVIFGLLLLALQSSSASTSGLTSPNGGAGSTIPPAPPAPPPVPPKVVPPRSKNPASRAMLWAHKTGAGFVMVGYSLDVKQAKDSAQLKISAPMLIHPGFIAPGVEPQAPGYGTGNDFYLDADTELERIENAAGVYQVLAPLNCADAGGGPLADTTMGLMLFENEDALRKMQDRYAGERLTFAVARTDKGSKFQRSVLYRARAYAGVFSSYYFPVLIELG